jgi:hypothetical protein
MLARRNNAAPVPIKTMTIRNPLRKNSRFIQATPSGPINERKIFGQRNIAALIQSARSKIPSEHVDGA